MRDGDHGISLRPQAGGHGGNVWAAARRLGVAPDAVLDLSTNTFARMAGRSAALAQAALDACPPELAWLRYPDPEAFALREALARREGVGAACILPGNGASELIWTVLAGLRPRRALFVGPMFAQYARACDALGVAWTVMTPPVGPRATGPAVGGFAPEQTFLDRVAAADADVVVVCSPNNPGTAVWRDPAPLLRAVGRRALLFDASYRDFLEDGELLAAHRYPRLAELAAPLGCRVVVVGSLTKFFCCPGARLGFVAADAGLAARLAGFRPAWTVSEAAVRVGLALLAHEAEYRAALPALRGDVAALVRLLDDSDLFRPALPGVSFAVAALKRPEDIGPLSDFLLDRRLLIRDCDAIPGMPPGFARIQARPGPELARLREELRHFASVRAATPE